MTTLQKLGTMVIGLGVITTLVLPGRQTAPVINAFTSLIRGTLATAMGTGKPV